MVMFTMSCLVLTFTMIAVGKTYQQVTIEEGTKNVTLPKDFTGPISPGAFPSSVRSVAIPKGFNTELEPGVITDTIKYLYLGEGYKHHIKPGTMPASTKIYIFDANREYAPLDRPFYLWRNTGTGNIEFSEDDKSKWTCVMRKKGTEPSQGLHFAANDKMIWVSKKITARVVESRSCSDLHPFGVPEPTDPLAGVGLAAVAINLTLVTKVIADLNSKIEALTKRIEQLEK